MHTDQEEKEKNNWLDNTRRATYNVRAARCGGRNKERRRKKKYERERNKLKEVEI